MHTSPTDNRIVRIKYTDGKLDTGSQQVLLNGILRNKFHNGGRLRFGPDGKLYAGVGDAQNGDNAQNLNSLNGKILRLNPDGSVPVRQPVRQLRVELRPPQRRRASRSTRRGGCGSRSSATPSWTRPNLVQKGGNYGWPDCEGTLAAAAAAQPRASSRRSRPTPTADGSLQRHRDRARRAVRGCVRGTRLYREEITGSSTDQACSSYSTAPTAGCAPSSRRWTAACG